VVTHDRRVDGRKCADTAPATPCDPEFPYVGRYVNTLSLAQVEGAVPGLHQIYDRPLDPAARSAVPDAGE
jgi:hypothetical protein